MRLGLNLAVFEDRSLASALDSAAALGVEAVELNTESFLKLTPVTDFIEPRQARSLRQAVESRGLQISAVGNHAEAQLIGGPFHGDTDWILDGTREEKTAFGTQRLLDTARLASELGVDTVVGFTGCEDWSRWFPWPDRDAWEKMLPRFVDVWTPILDAIGALGVRFAHEPHPKQLAYDLESSLAVAEALGDRPEWGYNLDTGNLTLSGVDPSIFVQALGDRIFHVHAKDFEIVKHNVGRSGLQSRGAWERHDRGTRFRVPGWGDVDWQRLISELQLGGYAGVLSIEHEDPVFGRDEGALMGIRFLDPLIPRTPAEPPWW